MYKMYIYGDIASPTSLIRVHVFRCVKKLVRVENVTSNSNTKLKDCTPSIRACPGNISYSFSTRITKFGDCHDCVHVHLGILECHAQ